MVHDGNSDFGLIVQNLRVLKVRLVLKVSHSLRDK